LTVDIGLALSIQHVIPKQTFIKYLIPGDTSRMEFNDKIGPTTIMHVIKEKL